MKTMYINVPSQAEPKDIDRPVRQKDEVLLRLLYGGICGSDPGSYKGTFAYFGYPRIPGHEFSAEIVGVDEDSRQGLHPEMVIACSPYPNCGHCYPCEHRIMNACMDSQTMGCQRDGAFQEYTTMPEGRAYDEKGLDPMFLAAIEPSCTSYHGISRVKVKPGDKALVIGAGTIGVLAAMATKARGAMVYISDVSTRRLDMAREFGVDGIILNDSPEGFSKAVKETIGGNGFDVVIGAIGLSSTFQNCIDTACFRRKVVIIGVGKKNLDLNFTLLQKKELNVFGSRNAPEKDLVGLTDLVRKGKVPVKGITANIYKFEDGAKAFSDFANNPGNMLKVILNSTGRQDTKGKGNKKC